MSRRIENRFVVMSIMEDLIFPTGGSSTAAAGEAAAAAVTADTLDGKAESVAEAAQPWDESAERRACRVRALQHLPSLAVTMGRQWAVNEVIPFLIRCVAEEDRALSTAVADVLPPLLSVRCGKADAGAATFEFSVASLTPVITQLCLSRDEKVRDAAITVFSEKILPRIDCVASLEASFAMAQELLSSPWPCGNASGILVLMAVWSFVYSAAAGNLPGSDSVKGSVRSGVSAKLREVIAFIEGECRPHELVQISFIRCIPLLVHGSGSATVSNVLTSPSVTCGEACRLFSSVFGITNSVLNTVELCIQGVSPPLAWLEATWRVIEAAVVSLPKIFDAVRETSSGGVDITPMVGRNFVAIAASFRLHPHWKMRHVVGSHIDQLFALLLRSVSTASRHGSSSGSGGDDDALYSAAISFVKLPVAQLCADCEEEVRVATARRIGRIVQLACSDRWRISSVNMLVDVCSCTLDLCQPLALDECAIVREVLVGSLADACTTADDLPNEIARCEGVASQLLAMLMDLLQDDCVSVQLAVVEKLDVFIRTLGSSAVENGLLMLCDKLQSCDSWRVRLAFVGILPNLCIHIRAVSYPAKMSQSDAQSINNFMTAELFPRLAAMVFDKAKAVRQQAIQSIDEMADAFGGGVADDGSMYNINNARQQFVDRVMWPCIDSRPESRQTYLCRIALLAAAFDLKVDHAAVLQPLVQQLFSDPICNVRLAIARQLEDALERTHRSHTLASPITVSAVQRKKGSRGTTFSVDEVNGWVIRVLRRLVEDVDTDVRHFASEALSKCF